MCTSFFERACTLAQRKPIWIPVMWGCRIYRLYFSRGVNECRGYDTKQYLRVRLQSSLLLVSGPLWPEVVVSVRIQCIGQIERFNYFLCWNHSTMSKLNDSCWLVGWLCGFLWHINLSRLFNAKSIFMQIVLFQTIQFSMGTQFNWQKHFYFKRFSLFKQF